MEKTHAGAAAQLVNVSETLAYRPWEAGSVTSLGIVDKLVGARLAADQELRRSLLAEDLHGAGWFGDLRALPQLLAQAVQVIGL